MINNRTYPNMINNQIPMVDRINNQIPIVDLTSPNAKNQVVKACEEFGFFKVVNHSISTNLFSNLETKTIKFFSLSQEAKERVGDAKPNGYGYKNIGHNGDTGLVEFLLLNTDTTIISEKSHFICPENPQNFSNAVNDYIIAVKQMAWRLLELVAEGLEIEPADIFSKMLRYEDSDCRFRINNYLPKYITGNEACNEAPIGFGAHTDPQLISVLRSNEISGLEILIKENTWLSVPPDPSSFFVNVDDCLEVLTNGRFKSVKHRVVVVNSTTPRLSMIYFGGPSPNELIYPLPHMIKNDEESIYTKMTWSEYKKIMVNSTLGDNRIAHFKKKLDLHTSKKSYLIF